MLKTQPEKATSREIKGEKNTKSKKDILLFGVPSIFVRTTALMAAAYTCMRVYTNADVRGVEL